MHINYQENVMNFKNVIEVFIRFKHKGVFLFDREILIFHFV